MMEPRGRRLMLHKQVNEDLADCNSSHLRRSTVSPSQTDSAGDTLHF
jgi:hypothetical protein